MEQKKLKMAGRDLHAGDVVRFNGELHQIGTIGRTDAFDENTMTIIHLDESEPVALADTEALKLVGAKVAGNVISFKGDGVSARVDLLNDGGAHLTINHGNGQFVEYLNPKRAFLHVVQQMAWKHGRGELKIRVPKPKKVKK